MAEEWILCPICGSKTRNKCREDTILINYPLYCPKAHPVPVPGKKTEKTKIQMILQKYCIDSDGER